MSTELAFICGLPTVFYFSSRPACWFSFPSHTYHIVFLFAFTSQVGKKRLVLACHFRGISLYWLLANSMGSGSEATQQRHHSAQNTCLELPISWLSRSKRTDGKGISTVTPIKETSSELLKQPLPPSSPLENLIPSPPVTNTSK